MDEKLSSHCIVQKAFESDSWFQFKSLLSSLTEIIVIYRDKGASLIDGIFVIKFSMNKLPALCKRILNPI